MLEKIKLALRIDGDELDNDIEDTINAAKADLKLNGICENKVSDDDPLIVRAVKTYCKAEYTSDNNEAVRYKQSYEMIRNHLALSCEYTVQEVQNEY